MRERERERKKVTEIDITALPCDKKNNGKLIWSNLNGEIERELEFKINLEITWNKQEKKSVSEAAGNITKKWVLRS